MEARGTGTCLGSIARCDEGYIASIIAYSASEFAQTAHSWGTGEISQQPRTRHHA
jgi:hypothetical protein